MVYSYKEERCIVDHSAVFLSLGEEIIGEEGQNKGDYLECNWFTPLSYSTVNVAILPIECAR